MSGVAVIVQKLIAHAPLIAIVAAARIKAGEFPLNSDLPCIGVTQISSVPRTTVAVNEASTLNSDRVQITVLAKTYPQLRQVLRLCLAACPHSRAAVGSIAVDAIVPAGEGPDFFDEELSMVGGSRDFVVRWTST